MKLMLLAENGEGLGRLFYGGVGPFVLLLVAVYVITAYPLYCVARRRGIRKPWLAWIPVGQACTMGSISDHYQLTTRYTTKNKRKLLLWLQVIMLVLLVLMLILTAETVITALRVDDSYAFIDAWKPVRDDLQGMLSLYLVLLAVAVFTTVVQYMALFDLYRSCDPDNGVIYLVLSLFVAITMPIFLMIVRNMDKGIPERLLHGQQEE